MGEVQTRWHGRSVVCLNKVSDAPLIMSWQFMVVQSHDLVLLCVFYRMSEVIEWETAEYHKTDPDPFDDRHPGNEPNETYIKKNA